MSVVVQAERHIPVEFQDIYGIVKGSMSINQRQQFEEVCKLIESLYAQDFMTLRRNLKHNFRPFSVGAKGQKLQTRVGKALPPKADLDAKELHLVADLIQLMARARFQIMTQEEWDTAKEERFLFQLPVAVNWGFFDKKLLTAFWNSSNERRRFRMLLPDLADRCLIFKRDVIMMEDTGRYINDKVELLISYALIAPLSALWTWIKKKLRRGAQATAAASQQPGSEAKPSMSHHNSRLVERRSLRRLLPNLRSLLLAFPRELTIQEPAYKEVVVVYRTAGSRGKADKKQAKKRAKDDRLTDILSNRNIHIKCFHDIPMADIDAVFPDKKVYMKLASIVNMIVATVMALVAVLSTLLQAGKAMDMNLFMSVGGLVWARFFQMYSSMQAERSEMIQEMTNILYDKTDDAQEGVLSMLLEDMAEQQLKEAVIAYIILFMAGDEGGASMQELDKRCEDFLEEHFGLKLDFAVEDTLPRLLEWKLVTKSEMNNQVVYNAAPVETAHRVLVQRWSTAYEALGKPPKFVTYPLTSLLADPEQELPMLATPDPALQEKAAVQAKRGAEAEAGAEGASALSKRLTEFVPTEAGFKAVMETTGADNGEAAAAKAADVGTTAPTQAKSSPQ